MMTKVMHRSRSRRLAAGWLCALCSACSQAPSPTSTTENVSAPVSRTAERGPVRFTVSVPRSEVTVGENIPLTIEVVAESGVAITMPTIGETLGPFEVSEPSTPPDIPDGGKRRWTHTYSLRTLEAGDMQVPAITVKFADARNAAAGAATPIDSELTTEPFSIHIATLMTGEFDPFNFRDIKGTVEVPLDRTWSWWTVALAVAIAAALGFGAFLLFRRRAVIQSPSAPPLPPHEWALRELDRLAAENLIARGEHQAFFFRLSLIIRQYIEQRFGIMAAEQTTDEFLREVQTSSILDDDHRRLLSRFMRLADMVKFAKFQPHPGESEEVFAAARNFVQQTATPTIEGELADRSGRPVAHAGGAA